MHTRGSLQLIVALVLVLALTLLVIIHLPANVSWKPLIHAYRAPLSLLGVRVSLAGVEVKGMNVTATIMVQPPNPCTAVSRRVVEEANETLLVIHVEPPPPGTICIEVLPPPSTIRIVKRMPKSLGYTWSLRVTLIGPAGRAVSARLLIAASARNSDPSIVSIIRDPKRYEGRRLTITALYMHWTPPDNAAHPPVTAPPVTRSDWIIADSTAWIYVHGRQPQASWGEPVTITVVPRVKRMDGKEIVYLERVG